MTIEFIGMIHHRHASEIHPPGQGGLDRGYIREFAQAAEQARFDRVLVGYFSDGPDGFLLAASAAAHTDRLGFLIAHRPGFIAPTLAARKFATLDQITGGRAAIHVISGGDDVDQLRDGDTLPKDERYARTDEYVHILKRIWTETAPVDHAGQYYRFVGASTAMRCVQQPHIPIYFGGASDAAIAVAGKHADVYALWGETRAQVRELTGRVRAAAAQHGRDGTVQPLSEADPGADRGSSVGTRRTDQAKDCPIACEGGHRSARSTERGIPSAAAGRGAR